MCSNISPEKNILHGFVSENDIPIDWQKNKQNINTFWNCLFCLFFSLDSKSVGTKISDKSLANQENKLDINDVNITGPYRLSFSLKQPVYNHLKTNKVNSFYNIGGPTGTPSTIFPALPTPIIR